MARLTAYIQTDSAEVDEQEVEVEDLSIVNGPDETTFTIRFTPALLREWADWLENGDDVWLRICPTI